MINNSITASQIHRKRLPLIESVVATLGSMGDGWLVQEIIRRLPARGLSNPDVATLTKLLREAKHVVANANALLRNTTDRVDTPPKWSASETAIHPKGHAKTTTYTIEWTH